MASVYDNKSTRKALAQMCAPEVHDAAFALGTQAKVALSAHRDTGAADIEMTYSKTDALISLVDPAALSIEFGRGAYTTKDGRNVGPAEGLHILGKLL